MLLRMGITAAHRTYTTYTTYTSYFPKLPKPRRLPCAFQHRLPEFAVGVDLPATMRRERDRKMHEGAVPAAYEEVGLSSHAGVNGVLGELGAIHVVLSVRGNGTDDVARV